MKVFQAAQPGQRPSHFGLSWPHSEQAKLVRCLVVAGTVRIMARGDRANNGGMLIEVGQSMDSGGESMVISCVETDCFFRFVCDIRLIPRRFFHLACCSRADGGAGRAFCLIVAGTWTRNCSFNQMSVWLVVGVAI